MKRIVFSVSGLLFALAAYGELAITGGLQRDGLLTWTNSVSNALYRIDSASSLLGPWLGLTNVGLIQASNYQVTVQLPVVGRQGTEFFRVAWADAPLPEPVGTWEYCGFDGDGQLVVTGLVSIATGNPLMGRCSFQSTGANSRPCHPSGLGSFMLSSVVGNSVELSLSTALGGLHLQGQMALDEYWGWWTYHGMEILTNGSAKSVSCSGRFSTRRSP